MKQREFCRTWLITSVYFLTKIMLSHCFEGAEETENQYEHSNEIMIYFLFTEQLYYEPTSKSPLTYYSFYPGKRRYKCTP